MATTSLDDDLELMRRVARLLRDFPGDDDVFIEVVSGGYIRRLKTAIAVDWCADLQQALAGMLGADALRVSHDEADDLSLALSASVRY